MLYKISVLLSLLIFKYFFSLEVEGRDCVPKEGSFILASNHLSNLDPPLLASVCPRQISFVAKKELFKNIFFKFYLKAVGAVPVERKKISIKTMRSLINTLKVKPLLVFPEGSRGVGLNQVYSGIGFLCRKGNVPVIAAKISGTDKILPPGKAFPKREKVKVVFDPVEGIDYSQSPKEITARVVQVIKKLP